MTGKPASAPPDEPPAPDATAWDWWWVPWRNRTLCGRCGAIMPLSDPCPVCGLSYADWGPVEMEIAGRRVTLPQAFPGAETWSHYVLLRLMHQEWTRPLPPEPVFAGMPAERAPSPRLAVVILYWSMFEELVTRLLEAATRDLPPRIAADLLGRHAAIGARVDRLYKLLFATTFAHDLRDAGYADVATHVERVQTHRNAFIHGDPEAIGDELVRTTVDMVPQTIRAWITLYNRRCARPPQ